MIQKSPQHMYASSTQQGWLPLLVFDNSRPSNKVWMLGSSTRSPIRILIPGIFPWSCYRFIYSIGHVLSTFFLVNLCRKLLIFSIDALAVYNLAVLSTVLFLFLGRL
jgi:hypothetical protein